MPIALSQAPRARPRYARPAEGGIERRDLAGDLVRVQGVGVKAGRAEPNPAGGPGHLQQRRQRRLVEQVSPDDDHSSLRLRRGGQRAETPAACRSGRRLRIRYSWRAPPRRGRRSAARAGGLVIRMTLAARPGWGRRRGCRAPASQRRARPVARPAAAAAPRPARTGKMTRGPRPVSSGHLEVVAHLQAAYRPASDGLHGDLQAMQDHVATRLGAAVGSAHRRPVPRVLALDQPRIVRENPATRAAPGRRAGRSPPPAWGRAADRTTLPRPHGAQHAAPADHLGGISGHAGDGIGRRLARRPAARWREPGCPVEVRLPSPALASIGAESEGPRGHLLR